MNIDWKWVSIIVLLIGFIITGIVQTNNNYNLSVKQIESACRDSVVN